MVRIALLVILLFHSLVFAKEVFFSVDNTSYIWKEIQVKQLQSEFAKHSEVNFSYASGEGNIAKQVSDLEKAIAKDVDLIIVSPVDAQIVAAVVEKAYAKGIKVIFATRKAQTQNFHSYIHPDDRLIAQEAAKYIIKSVKNPKVVMIQGRIGANTVTNRREGFKEVIDATPNAKITALKVGNYKPDEALKVMDEVIREGIKFNAVYTHNDAMQEGVRIALQKHGYDFDKVVLVGIDYIKAAQEAIKNGQMDATFTYPTSYKEIVQTALQLLDNKSVQKDIIVPSTLITKENINKVEPLF